MISITNRFRVFALAFVLAFAAFVPQTIYATSATQSNGGGVLVQLACAGGSGSEQMYVSSDRVDFGGSVTFTWNNANFSTIAVNGGSVNVSNGSFVASNITRNTIFQVAAVSTDGAACAGQVLVICNPPLVARCDDFSANPATITRGQSSVLTWNTTNATSVTIDNGIGAVAADGSRTVSPAVTTTYTLTAKSADNKYDSCTTTIVVEEPPAPLAPSCDLFTANPSSIVPGGSSTLTWETSNATSVSINNGIGAVAADGSRVVSPAVTTTYVLTVTGTNNQTTDCTTTVTVTPTPVPVCDFLTVSPTSITAGNSATLTWATTNATRVAINNGIGNVALDGSMTVSPLTTTTYTLTVFDAANVAKDTCTATVTVTTPPQDTAPVCVAFTATPSALPAGGGNVTFAWEVEDATSVTISPTIGAVGLTGTTSRVVTQSTTFTLTATDADGDQTSCTAPVAVADPAVFTCTNNVSFTASDRSIRRGDSTTLTWAVTGADTVSITDLGTVSLTGSRSVSPSGDRTYVLTATQGNQSIDCPLPISVSTGGGGGGGSSAPRCDLDISDTRITRGESITLRWDSSRASELTIKDDRGRVIVTTEDKRGDDKDDLFDGSIRLTPTRDTEYIMTVERGSRDRECKVEVEVADGQVLGIIRDQQPLVAGIALSQVPYTGFEAGPILTLLFYVLLLAWALYIAYFLVLRKRGEVATATTGPSAAVYEAPVQGTAQGAATMQVAQDIRPDVFAQATATTDVPVNLPVAAAPIGYENYFAGTPTTEQHVDQVVTDLENRAHEQRTLLSSDALEIFMRATTGNVDRNALLDTVIADAKTQYPLEDGWLVLNRTRMEAVCQHCFAAASTTPVQVGESLPSGSGSLAEAIVTGNIVAAYELIGKRPMVALANAAADLDSVVRHRKGDTSPISDLLLTETETISDEQLQNMITALTGAIDGTYTDEASAVKMAIMKAVKEIA